jgi:hypothetical protein
VLDERHSGNKNLKAVLNDVFRQCAAIGAQLSRLSWKFRRLKLGSLAIQGA